jgi:DNA-directed RNA polymerase subunit RPC12/RpoP
MLTKSKGLLSAVFLLPALGLFGCAGTEVKQADPAVKPYTATVSYVCPKCRSQMKRDSGQPQGFVGSCPRCGEKFLTF